jgi:hypothetical protein
MSTLYSNYSAKVLIFFDKKSVISNLNLPVQLYSFLLDDWLQELQFEL